MNSESEIEFTSSEHNGNKLNYVAQVPAHAEIASLVKFINAP
jgi:hypothetical protein